MKTKVFLLLINSLVIFTINAQNIKLISYNIRYDNSNDGENSWANRKDFLCAQLAFYEPDIFGIQEALPNQVQNISTMLPKYSYVGIARDGIEQGESSNIFFKKNKFKVVEQNTFWLSETPEFISKGWDAALNRVCTYILLKENESNKEFWIFNTHLDHLGEIARTKGIKLILSKIKKLNTKNYPVIFMGDFNSEPTDERILYLKTKMINSQDVSEEKPFGPTGTFNAFKYNEPVLKQIDYIFLSKESAFKVKKYAVLSDSKDLKYPSDHLPVYVEISFN